MSASNLPLAPGSQSGPLPRPKGRTFIVEGEIAAGKSELVAALSAALGRRGLRVVAVPEPVDQWRAVGVSKRFYYDPAGWGYRFQTFVFATRVLAIARAVAGAPDADVYLLERSPATDLIFMHLQADLVDPIEMEMYHAWCDAYRLMLPLDLAKATVLYLKPDLLCCMSRLGDRDRAEERAETKEAADASAKGGVSWGYQARLRRAHEAFFWGAHADEFPGLRARSPFPPEAIIEVTGGLSDGNFRDPGPEKDAIISAVIAQMGLS